MSSVPEYTPNKYPALTNDLTSPSQQLIMYFLPRNIGDLVRLRDEFVTRFRCFPKVLVLTHADFNEMRAHPQYSKFMTIRPKGITTMLGFDVYTEDRDTSVMGLYHLPTRVKEPER